MSPFELFPCFIRIALMSLRALQLLDGAIGGAEGATGESAFDERGLPTIEALRSGLKMLSDTDLRETLQRLSCPVTWLLGDKDMLVPVTLADALKRSMSDPQIHVVKGAGHAPFISDPAGFVKALMRAIERP